MKERKKERTSWNQSTSLEKVCFLFASLIKPWHSGIMNISESAGNYFKTEHGIELLKFRHL